MAQALQHHPAAQFAGLEAARTADHRASPQRSALRCREAAEGGSLDFISLARELLQKNGKLAMRIGTGLALQRPKRFRAIQILDEIGFC